MIQRLHTEVFWQKPAYLGHNNSFMVIRTIADMAILTIFNDLYTQYPKMCVFFFHVTRPLNVRHFNTRKYVISCRVEIYFVMDAGDKGFNLKIYIVI